VLALTGIFLGVFPVMGLLMALINRYFNEEADPVEVPEPDRTGLKGSSQPLK
jgi:hypothetical protein